MINNRCGLLINSLGSAFYMYLLVSRFTLSPVLTTRYKMNTFWYEKVWILDKFYWTEWTKNFRVHKWNDNSQIWL